MSGQSLRCAAPLARVRSDAILDSQSSLAAHRPHRTGDGATARCDVGLGLAGGLITITFTESDGSSTAYGRVTGGSGDYAGARGRVVIHERDNGADVTLTFHRT